MTEERHDQIAFHHALAVACAPVSADKARARRVERRHHVVNQRIRIGCGRVARNHHRIKRIYAALYKQIRNSKNRILDTGRNAHAEYIHAGLPLDISSGELERTSVRSF